MTPEDLACRETSLIDSLTVEEKAALCAGADMWHTRPIDRLCLPSARLADGPHGLRVEGPADPGHTIPRSLPATCFPTASALGSSWDQGLLEEIGIALARECRARGVHVLLGPGVNIKRSPLCGRNFEYFSEDPLVSGALGAAMVRGIQSLRVGATVKHFALNNQETDRHRVSADADARAIREIYLPAFEHIVTAARPWAIMCAYNRINGIHASENHWLLTEVLRDQWGYDGLVMSDWGAVHDRVAALRAGLDLEMPPNIGKSEQRIIQAVNSGEVDTATLNASAARVVKLARQAAAGRPADSSFDEAAHHALARRAAASSAVLLKNERNVLPLAVSGGDTIAVIGEFAQQPRIQGAGSSEVNVTQLDIPLDCLRRGVGAEIGVTYAAGFQINATATDEALAAEALAAARSATVIVAFLGLPEQSESEGYDRTHIDLPDSQIALLSQLAELGTPIAVVLANGSAVRTHGWSHHADAILEFWLAGQGAGGAIADALLGVVNPSGKLTETIPEKLEDCPAYLNFPGEQGHVRYGEGVFVGYRGYDRLERPVSFPFGHGLSYTTFEYDNLEVAITGADPGSDLEVVVRCRILNSGIRAGAEIVQLYVGHPQSSVARPPKELKGFTKMFLEPGEAALAEFRLRERDFSYWSTRGSRWVLEGGTFDISVAASSRDIRASCSINIPATPRTMTFTAMTTLDEWLADSEGARALHEAVGTDASGRPNGILGDPSQLRAMGNFPLTSLATFPSAGLDPAMVDHLLTTVTSSRPL